MREYTLGDYYRNKERDDKIKAVGGMPPTTGDDLRIFFLWIETDAWKTYGYHGYKDSVRRREYHERLHKQ